uniref:NADH-ubiquinone oxidoreductase chain 2 n=1 Tax=Urechis unicinctus TaxID=6432 RepID=C5G6F0_UREUN|nr:NADH dehydrogenase subunit 2 [Urechis unicinctus]ABR12807.1 NADH dehydrogenase subunit 2 [Urechis unicinctus]
MMSTFPHLFLFSSTMVLGTMISLSSSNWVMIWLGMELNLMSFLPLMTLSKQNQESEAAIKYFLAQCWGGSFFLLGMTLSYFFPSQLKFIPILIVLVSLMMKAGMAPCHFWFPSVMNSMSWTLCLLLSTWQKITPLLLLFTFSSPSTLPMMTLLGATSIIAGSLGGIMQTQVRPLLAYSSISHMGWMTVISPFSTSMAILYLSTYIIMTTPIMLLLAQSNALSTKSTNLISSMGQTNSLWFFLMILSLGGMPPTTGFMIKLIAVETLVNNSMVLPTILFLVAATVNLSFYLNLVFYTYLSSTFTSLKHAYEPKTAIPISMFAISMFWLIPLTSLI